MTAFGTGRRFSGDATLKTVVSGKKVVLEGFRVEHPGSDFTSFLLGVSPVVILASSLSLLLVGLPGSSAFVSFSPFISSWRESGSSVFPLAEGGGR